MTKKYTFVTAKISWATLLRNPKLWYEKGWGFAKLWFKLNFLRLISYARDLVLTPLLVPARQISESAFMESEEKRKVLVVMEKDVGLFALLIHVLNAKAACSHSPTPVSVLVYWGQGVVYWCKRGFPVGSVPPASLHSAWDYYFEPFDSNVTVDSLAPSMQRVLWWQRRSPVVSWAPGLERLLKRFYATRDGLIGFTTEPSPHFGGARTDDWYMLATVHGRTEYRGRPVPQPVSHKSWAAFRAEMARMYARHVRPVPSIQAAIDHFADAHLRGKGRYVIGVHVRATDNVVDPARKQGVDMVKYCGFIDEEIARAKKAGKEPVIYLATDNAEYVRRFKEDLYPGLVVSYDAIRQEEGATEFAVIGSSGNQCMPAFLTGAEGKGAAGGRDVLVEYSLLCCADVLVHAQSAIVSACLVARPGLAHRLVC